LVAGTFEYSILDSTHFRGVWVTVTALACIVLNTCHAARRPSHAA